MRVGIHGIGCVGAVTGACLARQGHDVFAFDLDRTRRDFALREPGLAALVADVRATGRLRILSDAASVVAATEMTLLCVGTPATAEGGFDASQLISACESIGGALAGGAADHLVVVRSTVLPGTTRGLIAPVLERCSGRRLGDGLVVCVNPEFLREGSAIEDFSAPPKTVIGELNSGDGDRFLALMAPPTDTPLIRVDFETAELLKYTDNVWHALKVGFANEMGALAAAHGVDGLRLMQEFIRDERLNISPAYLRPGGPYGGPCLPKDLLALRALAASRAIRTPILDAVAPSNDALLERILACLDEGTTRRYGIVGLGFKPGTDDLRGSPFVALGEALLGRGHAVQYFDRSLNGNALPGAGALRSAASLRALLAFAESIVLCHRDAAYNAELRQHLAQTHRVLDLGGASREACGAARYAGIAW